MKILWLTNVPLSKVRNKISSSGIQTGGWLDGMSGELLKRSDIEFVSVFPYSVNQELREKVENINFVAFPSDYNDKEMSILFNQLIADFNPDVIHIFGTEFKHTVTMMRVCKNLNILNKTVISIQGLCYIYALAYYAELPLTVVHSFTLRDFIKQDNIRLQKKKFEVKGKNEIEALKLANHVIGRTDWDKACTMQINPEINYHFCNETLRNSFYEGKWDYINCEKHSIFVSQCSYPIKGFHKLLKAMPLILKRYPDTKIYTTGKDLINLSFKDRLKLNGYQKYLIRLIKKNGLTKHVEFLGMLNEQNMKQAYLNANCFVSCSSIENSPNSVGEAMLLGVPTISSDVGGVKNLLTHNKEGYIYPFSEEYMLAYYVCKVFEQQDCKEITTNAKRHAEQIYDKETNLKTLIEIYNKIIKD